MSTQDRRSRILGLIDEMREEKLSLQQQIEELDEAVEALIPIAEKFGERVPVPREPERVGYAVPPREAGPSTAASPSPPAPASTDTETEVKVDSPLRATAPKEPAGDLKKVPAAFQEYQQNRTFLEKGKDGRELPSSTPRKLDDIRDAIKAWEGEVNIDSLAEAWGIGRHQAMRVITQMQREGVLHIARMQRGTEPISYTADRDASLEAKLPQASVPWQKMPGWTSATNKDSTQEIVARGQNAVLSVIERGGSWVAREVEEEIGGLGFAYTRITAYLRDLDQAKLVRRLDVMRRGRNQTAGRTAVQYTALETALRAVEPTAEVPDPVEVEEWIRSKTRVTSTQMATEFGQTVQWAGTFLSNLKREGVVDKTSGSNVWTVKAQADGVHPETLAALRDYATSQPEGDAFTHHAAAAIVKCSPEVALAGFRQLAKDGKLQDISPSDDHPLFSYERPSGAGAGAELDAKRRAMGQTVGGGSAPVAGTGGRLKVPDKDVDAILRKAAQLGGKYERQGNDHFRVTRPGRSGSVTVAGTPSRAALDRIRKRIRTELGLAV